MIANYLNGFDYLMEAGSIFEKAVCVSVIVIPIVLLAVFSARHKGTECAFCHTGIPEGEIEGVLMHPLCKKCYQRKFNNDFVRYENWLKENH